MPHRVDAIGRTMARTAISPKPRVLVVMDDPLARVLEAVLDHGWFESHLTLDPSEFARSLREWAPHVVLLDLDAHHQFLELSQAGGGVASHLALSRRREAELKLRS